MSATEYNPCQKCGMPLLPTQPNKCSECGWPATTVHGTGSGEAKDWFESMPSLSDVPTLPVAPHPNDLCKICHQPFNEGDTVVLVKGYLVHGRHA